MEWTEYATGIFVLSIFISVLVRCKVFDWVIGKIIEKVKRRLMEKVSNNLSQGLMEGVGGIKGLENILSPLLKSQTTCFREALGVNYLHVNNFTVYIPYYRKCDPKYHQVRVYIKKNGQLSELKQQPGVPFLVNAKQLNGDCLLLKYEDKEIWLDEDTVPTFQRMEELFTSASS
jgi:hypothetical protein